MTDFTHDPNQNSFSGQAQELSELIQAGGIQNGKLPDDLSAGPHTDLESAMESQGKQFNPPVPQTDSEDAIEPEKPARKPRSRKSKTPEEPVSEPVPQEPEALPEDEESDTPAVLSTGEKTPRRAKKKIVAIDEERQVLTDADRIQNDLLDLVESMKIKRILTDSIRGVERGKTNPDRIYAVVYHGEFKVLIPSEEAIYEPDDYRGQRKSDVLYYMLNKRMGAEIDYVIRGVDPETGMAGGSRMEAMALKRKAYFYKTDRNGNYQLYVGSRAEARVVSVIRAGIFVDLFGAECYIPLKELSYQRWVDASQHFQPGQRVLVRIIELDRSDWNHLHVTVSVKQASANPYEKALKRYVVGERYVGTVSLVDLTGVFVSLDGGVDCLCTYPPRGRPPRGARVTVRILGVNTEKCRIWGTITHMSTTRWWEESDYAEKKKDPCPAADPAAHAGTGARSICRYRRQYASNHAAARPAGPAARGTLGWSGVRAAYRRRCLPGPGSCR